MCVFEYLLKSYKSNGSFILRLYIYSGYWPYKRLARIYKAGQTCDGSASNLLLNILRLYSRKEHTHYVWSVLINTHTL